MSSAGNKFITNAEAVPLVESDAFAHNQQNRFAIGMLTAEDIMSNRKSPIVEGYLKLRANVYIDQTRMLKEDARRPDGTEIDEDDERSTHFVVMENRMGKSAVFACMRLIEKTDEYSNTLPIEDFFTEAFTDDSAPIDSIEASRFIVRHDDEVARQEAKVRLVTTGLIYAMNHNLDPIYAVVEPEFERNLRTMRLPVHRLAEPKLVSEYNDDNVAVVIGNSLRALQLRKKTIEPVALPLGTLDYWGSFEMSEDDTEAVYGS